VTRAADPVRTGTVDRAGVRVHYEVYGAGQPVVLLLMPNTITRARAWKAQVPWLSRTHTVVVVDPRGNGGSDPSPDPSRHTDRELLDDAWAVLDAVPAERAAGWCGSTSCCATSCGASVAEIRSARAPRVGGGPGRLVPSASWRLLERWLAHWGRPRLAEQAGHEP
jgi:pimeloyl-ACP methyl ester carboxylesterase